MANSPMTAAGVGDWIYVHGANLHTTLSYMYIASTLHFSRPDCCNYDLQKDTFAQVALPSWREMLFSVGALDMLEHMWNNTNTVCTCWAHLKEKAYVPSRVLLSRRRYAPGLQRFVRTVLKYSYITKKLPNTHTECLQLKKALQYCNKHSSVYIQKLLWGMPSYTCGG